MAKLKKQGVELVEEKFISYKSELEVPELKEEDMPILM